MILKTLAQQCASVCLKGKVTPDTFLAPSLIAAFRNGEANTAAAPVGL